MLRPTLLCAVHMEDISAPSRMLSGLEAGFGEPKADIGRALEGKRF